MVPGSIDRASLRGSFLVAIVAIVAFVSMSATTSARQRTTPRRHSAGALLRLLPGGHGAGGTPRVLATAGSGSLTFDGVFASGQIAPFSAAQCAPHTPSKPPRLRGTLNVVSTSAAGIPAAAGPDVAEITDPPVPASLSGKGYTLVSCALLTAIHTLPLGQTVDYGLMVYVPSGWSIPNHAFYGDNIEEFQFQGIYGSPVTFELHGDESPLGPHVTLALETGVCRPSTMNLPGCAYRSNADNKCNPQTPATCLPGYYVIPPGAFVEGKWNEIVMAVDWAASGGSIQTYYRVEGASAWNRSATVTGIPTVQWPLGSSGPGGGALEETESYTAAVTSAFSLYLDNDLEGTSLNAVEAAMP